MKKTGPTSHGGVKNVKSSGVSHLVFIHVSTNFVVFTLGKYGKRSVVISTRVQMTDLKVNPLQLA